MSLDMIADHSLPVFEIGSNEELRDYYITALHTDRTLLIGKKISSVTVIPLSRSLILKSLLSNKSREI